jgi:hypothetical protein
MRFKVKATLVAGLLLSALSMAAQATVLIHKSFDQLVSESEGIVVGTVRLVQVGAVGRPGNLHTYVTLDDVQALSGQVPEGRLTLRLKGGFDGRQGLQIEGAPAFRHNERVLVFVKGNGRELVPIVGWKQGLFRIRRSSDGRSVVHDADGNDVVGIRQGEVVRHAGQKLDTPTVGAPGPVQRRSETPRAGGGRADDGSAVKEIAVQALKDPPMSLDAFVDEVNKRARTGTTLRSVQVGEMTAADLSAGGDEQAPAAPL